MLRFRLFGIPVSVEPWFWVMAFVLGRGLDIRDRESLISTVIFAALVFISILVHELGHALSGRWLAGERQSIRLWKLKRPNPMPGVDVVHSVKQLCRQLDAHVNGPESGPHHGG